MKIQKFNTNIVIPILIALVYIIYFYVVMRFMMKHNMIISINNITTNYIRLKVIGDFIVMLLVPLFLILIYRKRLTEFNFHFRHTHLQYILITIIIVLFFLHADFTVRGYYKLFFYLVVVGFGEEFIFRGYVYNKLQKHNKLLAIVVSGFFWGISHAILPGLLKGDTIRQIGISMLSEIGGGIVAGYYFIYLLEKSKSIFIPTFVHAILDYTVGYIGPATAIGTGFYLYILDRRKLKEQL